MAADGAGHASEPPAGTRDPRPTVGWMLSHPWHLLALAGGAGLPRLAPGTWGTLFGWASFAALDPILSDRAWAALIIAGLYFGAWAAQRAGESLGQPDSGHIVIDEVIAFWIVLLLLPGGVAQPVLQQACAFVLFRVFDIAKPAPIRRIDARWKNGAGVMLDDLVAAFYTLLAIAVWYRVFG